MELYRRKIKQNVFICRNLNQLKRLEIGGIEINVKFYVGKVFFFLFFFFDFFKIEKNKVEIVWSS